jgi:hypothetical protein
VKRPRPLPMPALLAANRNAATVFLAVVWLANGRRQLGTTRARIREACGLSERCIGAALDALHEGGWLVRRYSRKGHRTWFRLTLPSAVVDFGAVVRKAHHRERRKVSKNVPQGTERCGTKNIPHSRKGVGEGPALNSGDPAPTPIQEHPSARIERELMTRIRAKRLDRSATPEQIEAPSSLE